MKKIILIIIFVLPNYIFAESEWIEKFYDSSVKFADLDCCDDGRTCYALAMSRDAKYIIVYRARDTGTVWVNEYVSYFLEHYPLFTAWTGSIAPGDPYYYYFTWKDKAYISVTDLIDSSDPFSDIKLGPGSYSSEIGMLNIDIGLAEADSVYSITFNGWHNFESYSNFNKDGTKIITLANKIHFLTDSIALINDAGGILQFNIYTREVVSRTKPPRDTINDIGRIMWNFDMVDEKMGFGCGVKRINGNQINIDIIYKTIDGGKSWEVIYEEHNDPQINGLRYIAFYDKWNGVAVGQYGKILMTNDGGESWIWPEMPERWEESTSHAAVAWVDWSSKYPIIATIDGGIYRYEGDFFDFDKQDLLNAAITEYPECGVDSMSSEINFDWGSVKDAVFYHFQLSLEPDLNSFIYEKKDFAKHSLKVGDLDSGQTYYWRVRGYNYDVVGEWSEICEFRVVKKASSVLSETNDLEVRINQNRLSIILKKQYYNSPKISIQDMQGKVIFSRDLVGRNEVIDLSDLADGVYFYSVIIDGIIVDNNKFIFSE